MMNINKVEMTEHNDYYVNDTTTVVNNPEAYLYDEVQVWKAEGNTPDPFVAPTLDYKQKRAAEYPSVQDQLDMMFHDKLDGTTTWVDSIATVKTKHPKP